MTALGRHRLMYTEKRNQMEKGAEGSVVTSVIIYEMCKHCFERALGSAGLPNRLPATGPGNQALDQLPAEDGPWRKEGYETNSPPRYEGASAITAM